jgi:hypothetical protein
MTEKNKKKDKDYPKKKKNLFYVIDHTTIFNLIEIIQS